MEDANGEKWMSREVKCICSGRECSGREYSGYMECSVCHSMQHKECMEGAINNNSQYKCAECTLTHLDLLSPILDILSPIMKVDLIGEETNQAESRYIKSFALSQEQYSLIQQYPQIFALELRSMKLAGNEDEGKIKALVFVNGQLIYSYKSSNCWKQRLSISNIHAGVNLFQFFMKNEGMEYVFLLALVEKYTKDKLFSQIIERNTQDIEESRYFVMQFAQEKYANMELDSALSPSQKHFQINLKCPFTLQPVRVPVRGRKCTHIEVIYILYIYILYSISIYNFNLYKYETVAHIILLNIIQVYI